MKHKRKTGRRLLSFFLTLAMVFSLFTEIMSRMSITVLASEVTIGNNGYPYGKDMNAGITFIVDVNASSDGT